MIQLLENCYCTAASWPAYAVGPCGSWGMTASGTLAGSLGTTGLKCLGTSMFPTLGSEERVMNSQVTGSLADARRRAAGMGRV